MKKIFFILATSLIILTGLVVTRRQFLRAPVLQLTAMSHLQE